MYVRPLSVAMATTTETAETAARVSENAEQAQVDPRAPRFGQGVTSVFTVAAIALQAPALVYAIAVLLAVPVLSGWRIDPYRVCWQRGVRSVVGPPPELETAAPHRFARLMGALFTGAGALALLGGATLLGFGLVAVVTVLALLAATTGFCLGCRLYGQVRLVQRLGVL
jgi:hypothetical protein